MRQQIKFFVTLLWRIMRSYSIPEKIVKMVKVMYSGNECAVIDGSCVYDWFEIKTDVKQGCCMSGFLFLLVVDWVMRLTTKHGNTGIRWKFNNFLEDLDFADDLTLISSSRRQVQTKVSNLGGMLCKNDGAQDHELSKDQGDVLEQHSRKI